MMRYIISFGLIILFFNCKEKSEPEKQSVESADEIIDKAIEVAGGNFIKHSKIEFDFRDIHFTAIRDGGKFQLERNFIDSVPEIRDVLKNNGFQRYVDGKEIILADTLVSKYSPSVNSVHYFSILPYGLDSKSVNKRYLGSVGINNKEYHKIKVTFSKEGGGEDYDDEYVYWINKETYTTDYLAYSYKDDKLNGLDFRFREAYNPRTIEGIRFVDYNNYKTSNRDVELTALDSLFSNNKLDLLSKIELKNIEVTLLQ